MRCLWRQRKTLHVFTVWTQSISVLFCTLSCVSTLLVLCRVVLSRVGRLGHVRAALWCHAGLHRVTFALSLLVILRTSTGDVCNVVLQPNATNYVFFLMESLLSCNISMRFFILSKRFNKVRCCCLYRVDAERLHLVSPFLRYGQEFLWIWQGVHDSWDTHSDQLVERMKIQHVKWFFFTIFFFFRFF